MHQDGFGSERYFHCFKYECLWVPDYFLLRRSATSSCLSQHIVRHHLPPGCASTHTVRLFFSSKGGWANNRAWNWLFDSFSIWICLAPFKGQWSLTLSEGSKEGLWHKQLLICCPQDVAPQVLSVTSFYLPSCLRNSVWIQLSHWWRLTLSYWQDRYFLSSLDHFCFKFIYFGGIRTALYSSPDGFVEAVVAFWIMTVTVFWALVCSWVFWLFIIGRNDGRRKWRDLLSVVD